MKCPSSIKINHLDYSIKLCSNVVDKDGDKYLGSIDHTTKEIKLNQNMPKEELPMTLLHEVIHAIDRQAGHTLQEAEVLMLSYGIHGVLKDNKKLRQFLFR